jgi:hypothetical protein
MDYGLIQHGGDEEGRAITAAAWIALRAPAKGAGQMLPAQRRARGKPC